MNISKKNISNPTEFKHNIHVALDPSTGDVVLCPIKSFPEEHLNINISSPTDFKHHVHAAIDPDTGRVIFQNPIINQSLSDASEDDNFECNNCQKLEVQLKKSHVKISQMQEENHVMYATAARLSTYTCKVYENGWCDNRFQFFNHTNDNLTEFEEGIEHTVEFLMAIKKEKLHAEHNVETMQTMVQELNNEMNMLQYKLTENKQKDDELRFAQLTMRADRQEFNSRIERADKELKLLKIYVFELQHENDQLRSKLRNLKLLFAEWNGTSARISGALYHETSVLEIKKENECLKKEIKQLDINRNRLNEEVSSTMNEFLRSRENNPFGQKSTLNNHERRSSVAEMDERKDNLEDKQSQSRNQIYNITAKTINMIEKSNIKYGQAGEVTDSEEEILV